jgi:putative ABC transport system permease protein
MGVGYALERGRSTNWSADRSTLAAAVIGVLVTLAALTFAVDLGHFVGTPADYGWGFDVVVQTGGLGDQGVDSQPLFDELSKDRDVEGWARSVVLQGSVAGRTESLLGLEQGGGRPVGPTVLSGRLPATDGEVAVGAITARHAGLHVGDTVTIGTADHHADFSVVGTVVLPGLRNNSSDAAALGEGATLTVGGLSTALQLDPSQTLATTLLIDLADGAHASAVVERLAARVPPDVADGLSASGPSLAPNADEPGTPAEVVAYDGVRATPGLVAAALAALSAFAVGLGLVTSVRRRRRELGTLRALGLTGRQVRGLVAWQATAVAVVGAVIGAPLGVLLGRAAWLAVAHRLGVSASTVVPWLMLALAVPVAILVTNLVAFVPGRRAGNAVAAEALRGE